MSAFVTYALLACIGAYGVLLGVDLIRRRRLRAVALQLVILAVVVGVLNLTVGFPRPVVAFGGASPLVATAVMFGCVVLGTAAQYLFALGNATFSLRGLIRPILVSPIVLLPLLGTIQGAGQIGDLQLISFAILAFQNGFFWKTVLDRAQPKSD